MGGSGDRFGSSLPKQFHRLGARKVYQHPLETFFESGIFEEIILVVHADWVSEVIEDVKIVKGGATRQESVYKALLVCDTDYVMIHDGVRPFVSKEILERNREAVLKHRAVDTCIPSADTIVTTDGNWIHAIPDRRRFWRGQTPQTFHYPLILEAHQKTKQLGATDDCQLVLELGHPVAVVLGEERNIKITSESDLDLAEVFRLDVLD